MPNPIQVEQSFQEMMGHFESTLSIRHRYRLFRNFIESLEGSFKKYESYILQIVDELPTFTKPLTWSGIDPEQIELDLALLSTLDSFLQLSEKSENFQNVKKRLEEVCLLLFGFVNDLQGVNHHLKISFGLTGLDIPDPSADLQVLSLLAERLSNELQTSTDLSKNKQNQIKRILREINEIQQVEPSRVLIPVAEIYQKNSSGNERYGRLRKISVERYSEAINEDELIFNTNIYGASDSPFTQRKDLLIASRALLESTTKKDKKNYYKGVVNFHFPAAFHDGNSANLAIAALWYTRLLEKSEDREKYQLHSDTVITGDINKEGEVLPIDEKIISLKLKAAFFSWAKLLAVPSEQRDLFEEELKKLHEKYPNRNLVLVGVNHLREIFYDRRLASHHIQSRFRYYLNRAKSQEYRMLTIPLIVVLLSIIGWLIIGPVDQNPVSAEFKNGHMVLLNQFGQRIQSLDVGERIIQDLNSEAGVNRRNKVDFEDINGDGMNEVFYARDLNSQSEAREEELIAYSVSGDSIIWKKVMRFDLQFPQKPTIGEDGYRIFNINFLNDGTGSQKSIILNVAHNNFFPALLLKINPETGEEVARYIHTGIIYQIIMQDLNGDQVDEIIGLGVNNAFNEVTVAFVLNAQFLNGHSPLTQEYEINGYQKANEMEYIQFPRSIVGQAFKRRFRNNKPYHLQIDEDEKEILVRIFEFNMKDPDPFEKGTASLFFYFNYDFDIQSIGTDSNYDLWAKNLFEDGRIPFEPDHNYFESLKDSLLFWEDGRFRRR